MNDIPRFKLSKLFLYFAFITILLLALLNALAPWGEIESRQVSFSIILLFLVLLVSFAILKTTRNSGDIFEPINLVYIIILLFFVMYPAHMLLNDYRPIRVYTHMNGNLEEYMPYLFRAVNYACFGTICFFFGYFLRLPPGRCRTGTQLNTTWRQYPQDYKLYLFLLAAAVLIWVFWIKINGGLPFIKSIITNSSAYRLGEISVRFKHLSWINLLVIVSLMNLFLCKTKRMYRVLLILLTGLGGLVVFTKSTSVSEMVLYLLNFVMLYHYTRRRITVKKALIVFLILLVVILALKFSFNISKDWSAERYKSIAEHAVSGERQIFYFVIGSKFTGADVFSVILRYVPAAMDYMGLAIIYQPLWNLLPTGFFKNLSSFPTIGNQFARKVKRFDSGGNNPTLFGIFHIGFGLPGILLGCFFYGIFCQWLYRRFLENKGFPNSLILYILTLNYVVIFFTRTGAPTVSFQRYFYLVVITLVIYGLTRCLGSLSKRQHGKAMETVDGHEKEL